MAFLNTLGRFAGLSLEKGASLTDLLALHRQRVDLSGLSAEQLDDIGLTATDVAAEVSRSPFDVPCNWRG